MKNVLVFLMLLSAVTVYAQEDSLTVEDSEYDESEYDDSEYDDEVEYDDSSSDETHYPLSPEDLSQKKGYTDERVVVQRFDSEKWKKVVNGEDFSEEEQKKKKRKENYDSLNSASADSEKTNSKRRMFDNDDDEEDYEEESGSSSLNIPFLNYIFYALAIGIIGYILFLIIKNTSVKSATKITKNDAHDLAAPVEDIKELEIDRLLREAMTAGNYRLVIRIYFLGLLKKLDEDGLIAWKKNKTNRDYLTELFIKARYFEEVKHLTLAYEEVWYGDHSYSAQTYEQIIASFKTIDQKLNADRPQ
jgi:hypothetical protein